MSNELGDPSTKDVRTAGRLLRMRSCGANLGWHWKRNMGGVELEEIGK